MNTHPNVVKELSALYESYDTISAAVANRQSISLLHSTRPSVCTRKAHREQLNRLMKFDICEFHERSSILFKFCFDLEILTPTLRYLCSFLQGSPEQRANHVSVKKFENRLRK
jgi:hypothetical protein